MSKIHLNPHRSRGLSFSKLPLPLHLRKSAPGADPQLPRG